MRQAEIARLKEKAVEARILTIRMIARVGVGHIGGALSIIDALVALYYADMRIDPAMPAWQDRDRFVLSKGHAGPALYSILAMKGYFDISELDTLNEIGTNLPSHCDMRRTPGVDMTAGSLGQGISAAVGMALGARMDGNDCRVYALVGDGESQEGEVWEAAMLAAHHKLDNLIAFTDLNKLQIDGIVENINALGDLGKKWEAFGWNVLKADGHDVGAIHAAIQKAKAAKGRPSMIILDTIKGKGAYFAENKAESHNMAYTMEEAETACNELRRAN